MTQHTSSSVHLSDSPLTLLPYQVLLYMNLFIVKVTGFQQLRQQRRVVRLLVNT
jgi:hypothetical protein